MPKIFKLAKGGKLIEGIFKGETINTPSMLCTEDYLDALKWVESEGGVSALNARCKKNLSLIDAFVQKNSWIHFLAQDPAIRSYTSVCLTLDLDAEQVKNLVKLLSSEHVAYDCASYRDAPSGIRLWCGGTIDPYDVEAVLPWIAWAYDQVKDPVTVS